MIETSLNLAVESKPEHDCVVVVGPTASGKTRIAVRIANILNGEIISADSRQVFRGMDIGTGKDLEEYGNTRYHLIDILDAGAEFSLFDFISYSNKAFEDIVSRDKLPVFCGGTSMYVDAVLRRYELARAPINQTLRTRLSHCSDEELVEILKKLRPALHNSTDLTERERTIRAIEITSAEKNGDSIRSHAANPLIIGIMNEREVTRDRITARLHKRLKEGLLEEVAALHEAGVTWERLSYYGLEYRFVSRHLKGEIRYEQMISLLNFAIHDFAKKQETWLRRTEKRGVAIHWLTSSVEPEEQFAIWLKELFAQNGTRRP